MLISYPIIPAAAATQDDEAKFNSILALAQSQSGLYPVTSGNRWHGGTHLAPGDEPIRAIADGVIVAYRMAPDTKEYPEQGAYDTSFVLIKHETDSGENTLVVFYSLYMHLRPKGLLNNAQHNQLMPFLRAAAPDDTAVHAPANTRIWRKEVLGFGGQLYGQPTMHFEIFATEADFNAFWRDRATVTPGQHGSNDVFGDMHFLIPSNLQFAQRHPRALVPHRIDLPGNNAFYDLDPGQAGQNTDRLHVVVELSNGRRTATTYRLDAQGKITEQVGAPVVQNDYEYELFRLATALYPDCPSAGFEYLRFGRILGPDTTTRVENWQLIRYSDTAVGYINLADPAHQISVLSDADFPMYWEKLEEGEAASPTDGIANIPHLTELLQLPAEPKTPSLSAPPDFTTRAATAGVAEPMRHFICKHPSEWDVSDLETRYAELKKSGGPLHDTAAWETFKDHAEKMAFWPQTGLADRSVWHFHPLQFIRHYKKCRWLSQNELARTLPNRPGYTQSGQIRAALNHGLISFGIATQRITSHSVPLNQSMRKYSITSCTRQAHFLAQVMLETDKWRTMTEYGRGETNTRLPMTQYYASFYGRGIMQLTWAGNYDNYGIFRNLVNHNDAYTDNRITATSVHYWGDPTERDSSGRIIRTVGVPRRWSPRYDPEDVSRNPYYACDSGGFYWSSKSHGGQRDINRVADRTFDAISISRVSVLVNGGGNGYYERQAYARYMYRMLSDDTDTRLVVRYPTSRNNVQIDVDFTIPT